MSVAGTQELHLIRYSRAFETGFFFKAYGIDPSRAWKS